jgi:hypothetical protein
MSCIYRSETCVDLRDAAGVGEDCSNTQVDAGSLTRNFIYLRTEIASLD